MMIGIFSETDELFLFSFTIPLDDALILWGRIDMLGCNLESRDAKCMTFVFYSLTETPDCVRLRYVLVQLILFSQLHPSKDTYSWRSCSLIASCSYSTFLAYYRSTTKKSSSTIDSLGWEILESASLASCLRIYSGVCGWLIGRGC